MNKRSFLGLRLDSRLASYARSMRRVAIGSAIAWTIGVGTPLRAAESTPPTIRRLADLEERRIKESSGLAASRNTPGAFWTHNDSGGDPLLFCFDQLGKNLGSSRVQDAECRDWEDMGSFSIGGQNYLFIADTGDNGLKRESYLIYWGLEPKLPGQPMRVESLKFRYEDGPHDCEAVALDPVRREFLLVEKRIALNSRVYSLPWNPVQDKERPVLAKRIGDLPVVMATGADITSDGLRLVVTSYTSSLEVARPPDQDWKQGLTSTSTPIASPPRKQGEAICYGLDDRTLYLTSEKRPCPLFSITRSMQDNPPNE